MPLVVPEVNPQALEGFGKSGIVANPNCSTIQLVVALKPLHDEAHLERIEVATYQSVSGAGREAVEELARQSIAALSGQGPAQTHGGAKPIAFNCVPHIDAFQDNGYTREEMKLVWETRKILGEPQLRVNATRRKIAGPGVLRAFRRSYTSTAHARSQPPARANCWKMRQASRFWMSTAPVGTPRRLPRQRNATQFMSKENP